MQRLATIAPPQVHEIWALLSQIPDPEIPVLTITDLGMVLYTAAILYAVGCCCEPGCNTHAGGAGVAVTTFTEYFADPRDVFCCAFTGEYGC